MRHAHPMRQILLSVSLTLCACVAMAQSVAMTGGMGKKALLVINGGQPKALAAGDTHHGVKVISVTPEQAVVEVAGKRQTVTLGGAPVSVGGRGGASGGTQIVLTAGSGGHFVTQGSINGRGTQFVVDTGATMVAMSEAEARRLGIAFETGQRMQAHTANGVTSGYRISLGTVRIQDVEVHNVQAAVMPMGMPYILLGNSFLSRFQMKQENDTMTLTRRF
jgi:aspartyl protease family protein